MAPSDPARSDKADRRKGWLRWAVPIAIALPIAAIAAGLLLWALWSHRHHKGPYPYQPHSDATIPIGMNIGSVSSWKTAEPFVDRFKTSSKWLAHGASGDKIAVPLDASGYPLAIPAGADAIGVSVAVDPPREQPIDTYVLTYAGEATIRIPGVETQESAPGRITFKVTKPDTVSIRITVSKMSPDAPLRDIHIVRTDQLDLFKRGEIFNPPFVAFAAHFAVIRFMDWAHTNQMPEVDWATRATPDYASWSTPAAGVPVEVMVRLANEAHTGMWYNVPAQADDAFVRSALTYIRNNLAPDLALHVEYANEVWNTRFPVSKWAKTKAEVLWGAADSGCRAANEGDNDDACARSGGTVTRGWMTYYGYRSAQILSIAHEVFGAQSGKRLVGVLSGFLRSPTLTTTQILEGVRLANLGRADSLFGEYAITSYFGLPGDRKNADIIAGWAQSGPAGVDAALHEVEYGGSLRSDLSIAAMATFAAMHHRIAKENGLRLVAYEGGLALETARLDADRQQSLGVFYTRLSTDPRMTGIYERMAGAFAAAGGTELLHYRDVDVPNKHGWWPVLDTIYQTSSPRFDALVAMANRARAAKAAH
jgi:hypothetical protein